MFIFDSTEHIHRSMDVDVVTICRRRIRLFQSDVYCFRSIRNGDVQGTHATWFEAQIWVTRCLNERNIPTIYSRIQITRYQGRGEVVMNFAVHPWAAGHWQLDTWQPSEWEKWHLSYVIRWLRDIIVICWMLTSLKEPLPKHNALFAPCMVTNDWRNGTRTCDM